MKVQTTTVIQSGLYAFDKSRFVMTMLNILGVTEVLRSFKIVPEGKASKDIPESSRLEFLEMVLANNFDLSDAKDNTSGWFNRGDIVKPNFWEMMDSYFISICKFGSFRKPFATINSLSELYFRFRRFILLVQTKKVISVNYGGAQAKSMEASEA